MLKCILIVGVLTLAIAESQNQNVCKLVLDCVQEAQKAQQQCDTQKQSNGTATKGKGDKCGVAEQQRQIKEKTAEQKKMYVECLTSRLSQSFDVMQFKKGKKQEQCQSAIKDYQNSNGKGATTEGTSSSRKVRRAADDSDNDDKKDKTNNNNGTGRKGGKGKGGKGHGGNNPAKQCQRAAKQKFHQCKAIAECCSETTICHLQFELSTLHDDIRKLQLEVATKKHDCEKAKVGDQAVNSQKNSTEPRVLRDDPASSSSGGQSMQGSNEDDDNDTRFDSKNELDKYYTNFSSDEDE